MSPPRRTDQPARPGTGRGRVPRSLHPPEPRVDAGAGHRVRPVILRHGSVRADPGRHHEFVAIPDWTLPGAAPHPGAGLHPKLGPERALPPAAAGESRLHPPALRDGTGDHAPRLPERPGPGAPLTDVTGG